MDHRYLDTYRNNTTLMVYYGMRILVLLAGGLFLLRGDYEPFGTTMLVAVLMSIPSFVRSRYRVYVPFPLDFGIVLFIFLSLYLGGIDDLYGMIPLWDKIVHFQSGLLLSGTGFVLVYLLNESEQTQLDLSPGFVAIFAVVFSLAIGAVWEIVEFTGDQIFHSMWQKGLGDTMWDLISDGAGAVIFSTAGYFWMYRNKRLPFTPLILKMVERAKKAANKIQEDLRK